MRKHAIHATARPALEPSTAAVIATLVAQGGPPISQRSVAEARGVLAGAQAGTVEKLPVEIEDRTIPGVDGGPMSIRIVRPDNGLAMLPVVMYFHGGGWVLGDTHTHDRLIRQLANGAHAAVIFVNYTPSPEAHYPVPIEEAYAATTWVADHGQTLKVDPARLAVIGDSVGGNMAAAVTLLAKARGGPQIRFQLLFYPVTDATFATPSYQQFADGPWLTRETMQWFWNHYAPDTCVRHEPTASPLQATLAQLQGLPPALVITAESDVVRDEGEAYAHQLMQAGVPVTATRYLGTIHDFVMLDALTHTPAARAAIAQGNDALRKAFSRYGQLHA
jgi:acetyl esterase